MKGIEVIVDEDGKVTIKYTGFVGDACYHEARKLYQQLKSLGVDVEVQQIVPTQEAYTTTKTYAKERERL